MTGPADRCGRSVRPTCKAILAHLGDDPDELLAGTRTDRPVVAVRVRAASAGRAGRPGPTGGG